MFLPKSEIDTKLDKEIESILAKMANLEAKSEEYATLVERLSKLMKLKSERPKWKISPDTALVVAANIYGILRITRYEREHIVTSKSLGLAAKLPKV